MADEFDSLEQFINEIVETGILDAIGYGISIQDTRFKILYQNTIHKSFVGDHGGEYCFMAYEHRDHVCEGCPVAASFKSGAPYTAERTTKNDKGVSYFDITASPVKDKSGKIIAGIEVVRDITRRKKIEEALKESEKRFRLLCEVAFDGIAVTEKGVLLDANKKFATIFGYLPSEIIGKHVSKLVAPDHIEDVLQKMRSGFDKPYETVCVRKDGRQFPVEVSGKSFPYKDRTVRITAIRDISDRKETEEKLRVVAITDDLTGLFNRRGFFTLAEQQCKLADRTKKGLSLLYLDLDGLKSINDEHGHKTGDQALIDTAALLKKSFRESDIIARLSGDEFAVLLTEHSERDVKEIVLSHLQNNVEEFNKQAGRSYELFLSIGIAHYDPARPCSVDELTVQADRSMYEHKKLKSNR